MAFPTTGILDSFASEVGPSWTTNALNIGGSALAWATGGATGVSGGISDAYYNAITPGPDCEVFMTLATPPGNSTVVGFGLRLQSPGGAGVDGYVLEYNKLAGTDVVLVYRVVNGAFSAALTTINQEFSAGDGIGAEALDTNPVIIRVHRRSGGSWAQIGSDVSDSDANRIQLAGRLCLSLENDVVRITNFGGGTRVVAAGGMMTAMRGMWGP